MKYINEVDIKDKQVILRCDLNVPIENGIVKDDSRIVKSLETIKYLLDKNCRIVILSHLGRIKTREDKFKNSLEPVSKRLSELLNQEVIFVNEPVGMDVIKTCKALKSKKIVLLENTRFCDFPEKLESKNDANLALYWSKLGEIFVVDAFGSLHRNHASVSGISEYLPTYYGFLVKEEIDNLNPVVNNIKRPFTVFMGGAKIDDKLPYIKELLPKCDYLLLGGGIANSFLYALGYDIKNSLCTNDELTLEELKTLYNSYANKIMLPVDFVFDNDCILDLGTKTVEKYIKYFKLSNTIFINGTMGKFEDKKFEKGTKDLFTYINRSNGIKIAGGGDTLTAINKFSLSKNFDYLSSGGGASLEYISYGHLKAIDFIEKNSK